MPSITLTVTQKVLNHTATVPNQRQIAVQKPSEEIEPLVKTLTKNNQKIIRLGGLIMLKMGDSGAIWLSHNQDHEADFNALFAILALHPDQGMRFECEILG